MKFINFLDISLLPKTLDLKVNKSVFIAKLRQRYHLTLENILLHTSNHALKDMYILNYVTF